MSNSNLQHGRSAVIHERAAALSEDFGMQLFLKKSTAEESAKILAELGTFTKGKNKGKQRGFLVWLKIVEGGMDRQGYGLGVVRGGSIQYRVAKEFRTDHKWCEYQLEEKN